MIRADMYYTPTEIIQMAAAGYFPIKSRTTLQRLIKNGKIKTINYAAGTKRPYYKIKGDELLRFIELGDVGSLQVNEKDPKEAESPASQ